MLVVIHRSRVRVSVYPAFEGKYKSLSEGFVPEYRGEVISLTALPVLLGSI